MDSARPFRAFVSYCHADAAFAARLQRRLEGYRLPKRLADRVAPLPGQAPGRIGPIFRDRADLSAAEDLSAAVREAIAASSALVVVASPDAVTSRWVALEIELFRELHPKGPILVALARGEPGEALPAALRAEGIEPLAADFRREGDGKRLAFLKIVARLAGLPLDALVQRDAQRRLRRVTAITLSALVAALIMAATAVFALVSQAQAVRARSQAEGMGEFMMTDLRKELRGVGRLDVMEKVNQRVMDYYIQQGDISRLPDDSLLRWARLLHAMGEDYGEADLRQKALAKFREAHRVTEALLARHPSDTDRIFAHAQSEFWLGSAAWKVDDFATARDHFEHYAVLARRLVAVDPRNKDWQMEGGYAESNLGSLALEAEKRPDFAQKAFERAMLHFEEARRSAPSEASILRELADNHGWLADSFYNQNAFDRAFAERLKERALLDQIAAADPRNAKYARDLVESSVGLARIEVKLGERYKAIARLRDAKITIDTLATRDSENKSIARQRASVAVHLASLLSEASPPAPGDQMVIASALSACATPGVLKGSAEQKRLCEEIRTRESSVSTH
ncbi:MAG: toll/interleukin-1 receptor domain-containing protein [Sphingomonas sp.]